MGKVAYNVRPYNLGPLRSLVSCNCSEDPYKDCTFYVKTKTSSTYVYGDGPKIEEVWLTCNCCGKQVNRNIESMNILEKDLDF